MFAALFTASSQFLCLFQSAVFVCWCTELCFSLPVRHAVISVMFQCPHLLVLIFNKYSKYMYYSCLKQLCWIPLINVGLLPGPTGPLSSPGPDNIWNTHVMSFPPIKKIKIKFQHLHAIKLGKHHPDCNIDEKTVLFSRYGKSIHLLYWSKWRDT